MLPPNNSPNNPTVLCSAALSPAIAGALPEGEPYLCAIKASHFGRGGARSVTERAFQYTVGDKPPPYNQPQPQTYRIISPSPTATANLPNNPTVLRSAKNKRWGQAPTLSNMLFYKITNLIFRDSKNCRKLLVKHSFSFFHNVFISEVILFPFLAPLYAV